MTLYRTSPANARVRPSVKGLHSAAAPTAGRGKVAAATLLAMLVWPFDSTFVHAQEADNAPKRSWLDRLLGREPRQEEAILPVPDGVTYAVTFDLPDDDDLAKLKDVSDLERLKAQLPSGAIGLMGRANADSGRLISALEALGYYDGQVDITLAGVPLNAPGIAGRIEQARSPGPVPVKITVRPGKRYVFGKLALIDATTRKPLPSPDWAALGIAPGSPALSATVLSTESRIVNLYRDQGYARARVPARQATVDHASFTMDVVFHLDPGPKARFGPVTVSGTERLDPDFITRRVPFKEGDVFSPEPLATMRRELGEYGVFDSVRIIEADHLSPDGTLPVEVVVKEKLPRFVGFGAKYSTTEGPAANAYWGHRNLFGGAERLRLDARVSGSDVNTKSGRGKANTIDKIGYRIGASFVKPGIITTQDDLVAEAAALREITTTYTRQGFLGSLGIKRKFSDELSGQIGIDVERAQYTTPGNIGYGNEGWYTLIGVPVQFTYDNTGNKLDPTSGVKLGGKVIPYPKLLGSTVDMTHLEVTASGYLPLDEDKRYVLAGRVRIGSIVGSELWDIPTPHRFFAGGGGSVRGYDYQSLGPVNAAGYVVGGRSLFEASAEIRAKVTDTIGVVAFADAGMAFDSVLPEFNENLKYSAGIGVRYYTSIGPIRLDVARGLNRDDSDPPFGLYISLGQSF